MSRILDETQRQASLKNLPGWEYRAEREAITKRYSFPDFVVAFGFMTQVAIEAEKMDHHPEWTNVFRHVDILLTTHEAGGLTNKDIALARAVERIATRMDSNEP
jgi:4a-hydroxytetrahydrobiopterin dehydratase